MKKQLTVRDVATPKMWEYYYKWRNTDEPELEKDISVELEEIGYRLKEEDIAGEYNDIKGYLSCEVIPLNI